MKKLLLTLCIILFGDGILFAQKSALKITSDAIQINKTITSDGDLTLSPDEEIVFSLNQCSLSFFTALGSSSIIGPRIIPSTK